MFKIISKSQIIVLHETLIYLAWMVKKLGFGTKNSKESLLLIKLLSQLINSKCFRIFYILNI
jgi:hypothetical protein